MSATAHKKGLAEALLAFQSEAPTLPKDGDNPHFKSKFTPLDTIVETIRPLLAKHALVWTALPGQDEQGRPVLAYRLIHAPTNEELAGAMPLLLPKPDSQGLGSALTYARRYALSAVLNLVSDTDDDGNSASRPAAAQTRPAATAAEPQQTERPASAKQKGLLNAKASEAKLTPKDYANVVLLAADKGVRNWESDDQAQQFLNRTLGRLPARLVDPVLGHIAKIAENRTPPE